MKKILISNTPEETMAIGEKLGSKLRPGDVLALFGDLGAGKTTLTRGISKGLGLDADIHSPTFTLIHEHIGATPLYHIDLYRLENEDDAVAIGIEEYLYGDGVTIIEWADRMQPMLPKERIDIELRLKCDTEREIILQSGSDRLQKVIEEVN